jgi:hypothetical protein
VCRAKLHARYAETMEAVSGNEESRVSLLEDLKGNETDRLSLQERLEVDSRRPQSRNHKVRVGVCVCGSVCEGCGCMCVCLCGSVCEGCGYVGVCGCVRVSLHGITLYSRRAAVSCDLPGC